MGGKVAIAFAVYWFGVTGSGVGHLVPAPIVAATSSQYFTRTFNRLVEAPAVFPAPALQIYAPFPPIVVAPLEPPAAPVATTVTQPKAVVQPTEDPDPRRPNVATATAQASALINPLFLGAPIPIPGGIIAPQFQLLPLGENSQLNIENIQNQQISTKTTSSTNTNFESTSNVDVTKTSTLSESTNQVSNDLEHRENFEKEQLQQRQLLQKQHQEILRQQKLIKEEHLINQQLLERQHLLVKQLQLERYQQLVRQQQSKQSTLKTSVEIVPVPLAYIAPPPTRQSSPLRQLHTFVPSPARIIAPAVQFGLPPRKAQGRLITYNAQAIGPNNPGFAQRPRTRDIEQTTFRIPTNRFNNDVRPPRK